MKRKKTIKIPKNGLSVRASFTPDTFDEENRTIEVVFSTGAKGKRGYWEPYFEELSMKKSDVRMERLNQGAPVLNNHSRYNGLEGIIGVVEKAWIRNKEGIATLRLSSRDELQGIVRDIQDGIIRNVSVGYTVHKYEDVSKKGDEVPTYRATDWEPMEISFVDIPFDKDSQSRSLDDQETYECIIENTEESKMLKEQEIREAGKTAGLSEKFIEAMVARITEITDLDGEIKRSLATQEKEEKDPVIEPEIPAEPVRTQKTEPVVDVDEAKRVAAETERARGMDIRKLAKDLGLDDTIANEHVEKGTDLDSFRNFAIESRAKMDELNKTTGHSIEVNDMENRQSRMAAAENALLHKFDRKAYELTESGTDFRFSRLTEIARKFLESEGVSTSGMADAQVAERALHSSSDFQEILANVANKTLRDAYDMGRQTFGAFVRETEVSDFKEISRTQLHSGAGLSEVKESGEYEHTTMSESAEKYSIKEYGKIIGLTRKTLINDDLNAFTRVPAQMGLKARALESKLIWAIITSNPLMADGNALFSAAHGNLGTAGAISVTTVNEGISKMMLQKDLDDELLDITPSYMAGPSILGATIKSFLGATIPSQDSNVNPFKGDLDPIIEARLDASSVTAWYLMASSQMIDMIEIARLEGQNGPSITQKEGFETSGLKLKVSYDFGAKVLDHRGFFKNAGA